MAETYTLQRTKTYSANKLVPFSVLFDTSYPAGGYKPTLANLGLNQYIDGVVLGWALSGSNVLIAAWDASTNAIRLFYPTGGASAAPAAVAQPVAAANTIGSSTATPASGATNVTSTAAQPAIPVTLGTITAGAFTPGAGKEIATGTDVSGYTVFGVAVGV